MLLQPASRQNDYQILVDSRLLVLSVFLSVATVLSLYLMQDSSEGSVDGKKFLLFIAVCSLLSVGALRVFARDPVESPYHLVWST